jgi:TDG/mug DNA glycosylase family protein
MRVLVCGLNPSVHAAERGVGFARRSNRFWPCAVEAGLVSRLFDPLHALAGHGVGMTDIVKRATARSSELSAAEYAAGLARVARLVAWFEPRVVCFVGLEGWRSAFDRAAQPGVQERTVAGRPVYLMPSTSGLNARTSRAELVAHLTTVRRLGMTSL